MSIEALWSIRFGAQVGNSFTPLPNAGVVIAETGRLLGGDAWMYYVGKFEHSGAGVFSVTLDVKVHHQTGGVAYDGRPLRDLQFDGQVTLAAGHQSARAVLRPRAGGPDLHAELKRIAELP